MNDAQAERLIQEVSRAATAIEFLATLIDNRVDIPSALAPAAPIPAPKEPSFQPIGTNTAYVPATCPIHGYPWRVNRRGPYCSGHLQDGSWCNQKPTAPRAIVTNAIAQLP